MTKKRPLKLLLILLLFLPMAFWLTGGKVSAAPRPASLIVANVVALDQVITYNRFGSFNPNGMIYALRRDVVDELGNAIGAEGGVPGRVRLRDNLRPRPLVLRANVGDTIEIRFTNLLAPATAGPDWPATRDASIVVTGMTPLGDNHNPENTGLAGISPGQSVVYRYKAERDGTYFFFSNSAPAGGEGDGGSLVHGLFGTLNVQPAGSNYYRSQVSAEDLSAAKNQAVTPALINYEAMDANGDPILNMLKPLGANTFELIKGDLNALVVDFEVPDYVSQGKTMGWYREFTVIMHGELKTFYQQAFQILEQEEQLAGVRDGYGINYGASGLGPVLLANRTGVGPAKDCVDCAYEEFWLQSWANGDPALLVQYGDDPSNVHHSYLGDNVRFRNIHAGPKETHIFHLHAHQWTDADSDQVGNFLDSQTIGPNQGFSFNIFYGGSGNRNLTQGDSIFHCHLYPHFAQGMWELWRVHDTFTDGTRTLPDGVFGPGTDPKTGVTPVGTGTPTPAVVPMPGQGLMPNPTYAQAANPAELPAEGQPAMPGYPYYVPGEAGHRAPQPPMDIVENAGLPRHVVLGGGTRVTHEDLGAADFSVHVKTANLKILPDGGTPAELDAMRYHGDGAQTYLDGKRGYDSVTPEGNPSRILVNGKAPQPGAPFADPCVSDEWGNVTGMRDYHVSAIQLDLLVNAAGWHDPQARINVLDEDVERFEGKLSVADPFFFRVNSGECVRFFHTNRTPKELQVDDFQVRTPTDIIGQHIHLVKFDVMSADGSANGWNYEDGTYSRDAVVEMIHASKAVITNPDGTVSRGSVVDMNGDPLPELHEKVDAAGNPVYQTTIQRWWADPLVATNGGDRTIGTVFSHDHYAPSSIQQHGFYNAMIVEPAGSEWKLPNGDPMVTGVGTQAMIVNADDPVMHPDHREFSMFVADFALLYDGAGNPIDPPLLPEAISTAHHNPYLVNYKNEPIPLRISELDAAGNAVIKPGPAGDMAYVFDSKVHGDPFTEIFRAYEGDNVRLKLLQGAHEAQHAFSLSNIRWKRQSWNPDSPYINAQEIGISEHFAMHLPKNPVRTCPGGKKQGCVKTARNIDHLYHFGAPDDFWNGDWGLVRYVDPGTEDAKATNDPTRLASLPNNPMFADNGKLVKLEGESVCEKNPKHKSTQHAYIQAWVAGDLTPGGVVYNAREGITDPSGLRYIEVPDHNLTREQVIAMYANKPVEPLVLRTTAGRCIHVHLKNMLPENVPDHLGDAGLPHITPLKVDDFRPSNRVSIVPQLVQLDTSTGGGMNVGINAGDQTAGPGETVDYIWYAGILEYKPQANDRSRLVMSHTPKEFGSINLASYGDIIKHGAQGLIGALIVEPEEATITVDPATATTAEVCYPLEAGVTESPVECFREHVVMYQSGLNLNSGAVNIPDCFVCDDTYDLGEQAVNYRSEPFWARLGISVGNSNTNGAQYPKNFFLDSHKSIETPVFTASAGQPVRFRVLEPYGRNRQRAFMVYGHSYWDYGMENFGAANASLMTVGKGITADLLSTNEGTWLFRDGPQQVFSGGVWGQFIVSQSTPSTEVSKFPRGKGQKRPDKGEKKRPDNEQ